ncbi:hypothetical protein OPV22_009502 [Ensete ventricosum]|uniref:Uncharacterized protein n=1 Tax=Ensete ventricosum TaxID=4639 RepID=A0AAV8PZQ3_ENSVE|nr:hypothetical protein OPV22_009502 [Ensete ventricosum]
MVSFDCPIPEPQLHSCCLWTQVLASLSLLGNFRNPHFMSGSEPGCNLIFSSPFQLRNYFGHDFQLQLSS